MQLRPLLHFVPSFAGCVTCRSWAGLLLNSLWNVLRHAIPVLFGCCSTAVTQIFLMIYAAMLVCSKQAGPTVRDWCFEQHGLATFLLFRCHKEAAVAAAINVPLPTRGIRSQTLD